MHEAPRMHDYMSNLQQTYNSPPTASHINRGAEYEGNPGFAAALATGDPSKFYKQNGPTLLSSDDNNKVPKYWGAPLETHPGRPVDY